jgi:hypothetical protein
VVLYESSAAKSTYGSGNSQNYYLTPEGFQMRRERTTHRNWNIVGSLPSRPSST